MRIIIIPSIAQLFTTLVNKGVEPDSRLVIAVWVLMIKALAIRDYAAFAGRFATLVRNPMTMTPATNCTDFNPETENSIRFIHVTKITNE